MATAQVWLDSLKSVAKGAKKAMKKAAYSGHENIGNEIDALDARVTVKTHSIVNIDFATVVQAKVQTKHLRIPKGFTFSVDVNMNGLQSSITLFEQGFKEELQKYASAEADKKIADVIDLIRQIEADIDKNGQAYPESKLQAYSKQVTGALENDMNAIGTEVQKRIDEKLAAFNKGQKDLAALEIKCFVNIATQVIVISVVAAASAASHGALTPFAAVGITRSGVEIVQSVLVLVTDCKDKAKAIDNELLILKALLAKKVKEKETEMDQKAGEEVGAQKHKGLSKEAIYKTMMETALGSVSGLLGVETPSLKNCKELIEQHHACIGRIDRKLVSGDQEIQLYKAKMAKAKPGPKAEKAKEHLKRIEARFKEVHAAKVEAEGNDKRFREVIADLSIGVAAWTKHVDTVVGATVDIGVGFGDFSEVIESFVSALAPALADAVNVA